MATQKRNALGRGLDALLSMDDVKTCLYTHCRRRKHDGNGAD